ncbi:hypothetical protein DPMN_115307 [Dreissena polymorpha]|uniref:C2H2-type domain-containing protein n=1 Tax=Dreissena polymorpha TaxID=45954 RepID=A0A9D4KMK9_DREPO|nr:hypothetical protein DPMN_115307 [Dreissena polymorpha]
MQIIRENLYYRRRVCVSKKCDETLADVNAFDTQNVTSHGHFTCLISLSTFTSRNYMKRHIRIHTSRTGATSVLKVSPGTTISSATCCATHSRRRIDVSSAKPAMPTAPA